MTETKFIMIVKKFCFDNFLSFLDKLSFLVFDCDYKIFNFDFLICYKNFFLQNNFDHFNFGKIWIDNYGKLVLTNFKTNQEINNTNDNLNNLITRIDNILAKIKFNNLPFDNNLESNYFGVNLILENIFLKYKQNKTHVNDTNEQIFNE